MNDLAKPFDFDVSITNLQITHLPMSLTFNHQLTNHPITNFVPAPGHDGDNSPDHFDTSGLHSAKSCSRGPNFGVCRSSTNFNSFSAPMHSSVNAYISRRASSFSKSYPRRRQLSKALCKKNSRNRSSKQGGAISFVVMFVEDSHRALADATYVGNHAISNQPRMRA